MKDSVAKAIEHTWGGKFRQEYTEGFMGGPTEPFPELVAEGPSPELDSTLFSWRWIICGRTFYSRFKIEDAWVGKGQFDKISGSIELGLERLLRAVRDLLPTTPEVSVNDAREELTS